MDVSLRAADVVAAERHRWLLIEAERERRTAGCARRLRTKAIPERAVTRAVGAVLAGAAGRVGLTLWAPAPVGCAVAVRAIAPEAG